MRFSVAFAVAAFASAVSANLVARQGGLPQCATDCIMKSDFDGCQPTDNACLCKSQKFVASSTQCIGSTCKGDDLQAALTAAQQLCAIVGVTLTSTPAGFPTSGGSSPTATAPAASGSGASHAASGSGAPAATSSGAGSTPSNAASINGVHTMAGVAALLAAFAL